MADAAGPSGTWTLVASDPDLGLPEDAHVDLALATEDDGTTWAGGTAACNRYAGPVALAGGVWAAGDGWAVTRMACHPSLMTAERDYLAALARVERWMLRPPGSLVLSGEGIQLVFAAAAVAPEPDV